MAVPLMSIVGAGKYVTGQFANAFNKERYRSEWHDKTSALKRIQEKLKTNPQAFAPKTKAIAMPTQKKNNKVKLIAIIGGSVLSVVLMIVAFKKRK